MIKVVARLKEDFLAGHDQNSPDVLAKDLDAVQVRVEPIAPGHVEKVHQSVVLAVAVALPYPDAQGVVLPVRQALFLGTICWGLLDSLPSWTFAFCHASTNVTDTNICVIYFGKNVPFDFERAFCEAEGALS